MGRWPSRATQHASRAAGLTLVEVLAAVVILAAVMLPLLSFVRQVEVQWRRNMQTETAIELARETMANAISSGATNVPQSQVVTTSTDGRTNTTYTIQVNTTPQWNQTNLTLMSVTVSWNSVAVRGGPSRQIVSLNQLVGP
ncbi:MAG: prepilin-type N-terminal cleavage/methylation domain-containing protein [Thermoflavifilum sp.]|nr:prepilin-type N-terminal cleavage/methylation domain-containing protein [Thermoflavifilum sp.]MCL6514507.1 prepilin-type N-terminal cleavage/methylation domain-containing protein [Alicyclobacillus sp.]